MYLLGVVGLPWVDRGLCEVVWPFLSGQDHITRKALRNCKTSVWSVFYQSLLDFSEQNWISALENFKKLVEKDAPEFLRKRSCFFLSYILTQQGKLDQSEEFALQICEDPQFRVITGNILGYIAYQRGLYEDSCSRYDSVLQVDPDNATASNGKACALLCISGKEKLAGPYIKKVLQKYPQKGEYLHTFGCFLLQQGQMTEGFSIIRKSYLLRNKADPPWKSVQ